MSDDNWRGGSDANPDDDFEDFGELRFSEEENEGEQAPLSFDDDNTGPLPHWTVKPTSELPRLFPEETTRDVSREVQRDDDGEVDVWVHILAPLLVQYLTVQLMLRRVRQATQVAVVRLFAWVIRALEQIVVALIPRRVRRHDRFHQRAVTTQVTPLVQVV